MVQKSSVSNNNDKPKIDQNNCFFFDILDTAGKLEKNMKNQIDYPSHHKILPFVYHIFFSSCRKLVNK